MKNQHIATLLSSPGSYALHLVLSAPLSLSIGRLGTFSFPAGDFLYLGSAQGPGGLRARLHHHARVTDRPHWHLDWFRPYAVLNSGWVTTASVKSSLECVWSQALTRLPGALIPAPGFGAADCRCSCCAHLIAFPGGLDVQTIETCLGVIDLSPIPVYKIGIHYFSSE